MFRRLMGPLPLIWLALFISGPVVFSADTPPSEAPKGTVKLTPPFVGTSAEAAANEKLIAKAANSLSRVLITGETGTGKDILARRIHLGGARRDKPYVAINAAELPETLADSLLFGVKKGAFTGANADQPGLLEIANGGTVFLDELGEMPKSIQVKLLRALEDGKFRRVGENKERDLDIRLISGTNKDLYAAMQRGEFREDLFYRLVVFEIHVPPLRTQLGDFKALLAHVTADLVAAGNLTAAKTYSTAALEKMMTYPWPGNIRELRNALEYSAIVSDGAVVELTDLPRCIIAYQPKDPIVALDATGAELFNPLQFDRLGHPLQLSEVLDQACLFALHAAGGSHEVAARNLGIGVRKLGSHVKAARANPRLIEKLLIP